MLWGSTAGIGIAILDLLIVGRRWEKIRELLLLPRLQTGSRLYWA